MKLIGKKEINLKNQVFKVTVLLDGNTDDTWNLFNLINIGDYVRGTCTRKVKSDTLTGLVKNEKKKVTLTLRV